MCFCIEQEKKESLFNVCENVLIDFLVCGNVVIDFVCESVMIDLLVCENFLYTCLGKC